MSASSTRMLAGITLVAALCSFAPLTHAQVLNESFDNVAALPGWVVTNASPFPAGSWFQGNTSLFTAQSGAANSYIAANFLASQEADIRLWLISPEIPLVGGETLSFYTRAESVPAFAFSDGLSVLLGVGGGTSPASFQIGLVELGPVLGSGPYPSSWQHYSVTIPTVAGMTTGRIAFEYFVEDAASASYIGIDAVTVGASVPDADGDGAPDSTDNCPTIANADQADVDADLVGTACDSCTTRSNPRVPAGFLTTNPWATLTGGQRDDDHDGFGNKCDAKFVTVGLPAVGSPDLAQFRASSGKGRTLDICGTTGNRPCAIFDLNENIGGLPAIDSGDLVQFRLLNGKLPGPRCATCPLTCTAGTSGNCN